MKNELGQWGENEAARFLIAKGYSLLDKNWRARPGEIDLVMADGEEIVFIEVKTRSGIGFGYPEEAITDKKIASLIEAGQRYIDEKEIKKNWRLDVVSIIGNPRTGIQDVEHIEGFQI